MIFKKSVYNKLNGFDERFFLYFEDTDFCVRLIKNNFNVLYNPDAIVKHFKGGSSKSFIIKKIYFYNSVLKFIFKYYYRYKMFLFFILVSVFYVIINLFQ